MTARPIRDKVKGLRQRQRADGTWRVWWEPSAPEQTLGFAPVELDADRPSLTIRQATALNDQVARARRGEAVPRNTSNGRTIDALIHDYLNSRFFRDLRPATRRSYSINLRMIGAKWGAERVSAFSKPIMNKWYETLMGTGKLHQALALTRMMSILFSHAETLGWRPEGSNPCFRLARKTPGKRGRRANWAEYDALIAAADALGMPAMACAIALSTLNAQRREDLLAARIADFGDKSALLDDGRAVEFYGWELIRSKRGNYGAMPVHEEAAPRVRALIDAAPDDQDRLLIDHVTGRPFDGYLFWDRWNVIRARAARDVPTVVSLQFRDLRRTFGNWARAGGASKADVADVLGNSAGQDAALGEVYMAASLDTVLRAMGAVRRPHQERKAREQ